MSKVHVSINEIVNKINEYNSNPVGVMIYIAEEICPWLSQITHAMPIETFLATMGGMFDDYFEFKNIEMDEARKYMRELCKIQENVHKTIPYRKENNKEDK